MNLSLRSRPAGAQAALRVWFLWAAVVEIKNAVVIVIGIGAAVVIFESIDVFRRGPAPIIVIRDTVAISIANRTAMSPLEGVVSCPRTRVRSIGDAISVGILNHRS